MKILVRGGRVIDPGQNLDGERDVLVEDGLLVDLVNPGGAGSWAAEARIIEVKDLLITPGLIDMHVHLREPGEEYKETIATGAAAAAAGGFTAVAAMPNTHPVNDNRSVTEFILNQARLAGQARVWPIAAMTRGGLGEELGEYGDLAEAGAVAISDDGRPVPSAQMMRRVLEYSKAFGLLAIAHAEELSLSAGGLMNEGRISTRLGLDGIPAAGEEIAVFRDVRLAELTGTPLHLAHISTAGAVEIIRRAKAAGVPVTAETAPHYFSLTEAAVMGYRTEAKVNPPLRTSRDLEAVRTGLADGTIDAIATDHAPHSELEKNIEFDQAACGIPGLETALPLTLNLVSEGVLTLTQAVAALSLNPAKILGLTGGTLKKGRPADLTVIDLRHQWIVEGARFKSLGRFTPFENRLMTGQAFLTMVQGRIVHKLLP